MWHQQRPPPLPQPNLRLQPVPLGERPVQPQLQPQLSPPYLLPNVGRGVVPYNGIPMRHPSPHYSPTYNFNTMYPTPTTPPSAPTLPLPGYPRGNWQQQSMMNSSFPMNLMVNSQIGEDDLWFKTFMDTHINPSKEESPLTMREMKLQLFKYRRSAQQLKIWCENLKVLYDRKQNFLAQGQGLDSSRVSLLYDKKLAECEQIKKSLESFDTLLMPSSTKDRIQLQRFRQRALRVAYKKRWRKQKKKIKQAQRIIVQRLASIDNRKNGESETSLKSDCQNSDTAQNQMTEEPSLKTKQEKTRKLRQTVQLLGQLVKLHELRGTSIDNSNLHLVKKFIEKADMELIFKPTGKKKDNKFVNGDSSREEKTTNLSNEKRKENFVKPISGISGKMTLEDYNLANVNMVQLIKVRREWDAYLVPIGIGSKIPQHFVSPPNPPNSLWEKYRR